jgi:hypothetical protein
MENIPRLIVDNLLWIVVIVGIGAFLLGAAGAVWFRKGGRGGDRK